MSFDFFNPSHLAFGSKLTKAFLQLERLCREAEDNQANLNEIYQQYAQYVNRNYKAPFPTRPGAPVRVDELFDLIDDVNTLKTAKITEDGKFLLEVNLFNKVSNRFTIGSGSTELKHGFAFLRNSTSNSKPEREIEFFETIDEGAGNYLGEFRIDSDNNINIVGDSSAYFIPSDFDHIIGIDRGDTVVEDVTLSNKKEYVATDYEAIICVGYSRYGDNLQYTDGSPIGDAQCDVRVNGKFIFGVTGRQVRQYTVIYLKPDDVLTGEFKKAFRVSYTKKTIPVPQPADPVDTITKILYSKDLQNDTLNTDVWTDEQVAEFNNSKTLTFTTNFKGVDTRQSAYVKLYNKGGFKAGDVVSFNMNYVQYASTMYAYTSSGKQFISRLPSAGSTVFGVNGTVSEDTPFIALIWGTPSYSSTFSQTITNVKITRG